MQGTKNSVTVTACKSVGQFGTADHFLLRTDRQRIPGAQIVQVLLRDHCVHRRSVILLADQARGAGRGPSSISRPVNESEQVAYIRVCVNPCTSSRTVTGAVQSIHNLAGQFEARIHLCSPGYGRINFWM